ncbi:hypothetical protein COCSADRAFT_192916 [Bipolaris sorokiniana ND90Pr]|uniref:Heterokaryon incompatibility domain-containing protein n=1 Tax=Cochliobolus sativus (strain ND90Pr / ATCC 201652) TaxID=665912 RepID=M2SVW8_COCSN|nr:uncharacterized protein COCSADRAFT_192916 [Bipolaris sorokiniana ND90Pr]EMD61141.1 hypothetical protein COCSADRAFT_192916 [Bipolaris sorokiniana ND90Pr]
MIARSWILDCQLNHRCSEAIPTLTTQYLDGVRPARMIDVAAFQHPSQDIRLVEMDQVCTYVALSYCWGHGLSYVTKQDTLLSLLTRISYNDLPQTFQHAITATRNLGYRYLWLDALCIVQDSVQDWERESQKMGVIYSQAVVTIAATESRGVHDGFFNYESCSEISPSWKKMVVRDAVRYREPTELLLYEDAYDPMDAATDMAAGTLAQRAWACQERILSARVLHYKKKQIYWECRQAAHIEEGIPSFSNNSGWAGTGPSLGRELAAYDISDRDLSNRIFKWYNEILHTHYSTRQLTYASDRLPAISGLAKLVRGSMNITYLAGLWKERLQFGLCWGVVNIVPRSTVNASPSWSWTSYETPVCWPMTVYESFPPALYYLDDFDIELASSDRFGRVNGGFLKITGLMCVVQVEFLLGLAHRFNHSSLEGKMGDWSSKLSDFDGIHLGAALLDRDPGTDVVHALILAKAETRDGEHGEWNMLLVTCAGGTSDRFERIGIAQVRSDGIEEKPLWLPKFERRSITLI